MSYGPLFYLLITIIFRFFGKTRRLFWHLWRHNKWICRLYHATPVCQKKLTFLIKWLSYCPLYLKQILHFCQIYGKTRLLSRELWRNNYHKLYVWSKCIFVWKRFFVHYQICQLWSFLFYIFKRWNFLFSGKPDINFFYYCHDYNRK